jgi:hypothetical protein
VASIAEQLESGHNIKLYFRIVTRGNHPNLVLDNVEAVGETLMSCLPREYWELEVATDNELNLEKRTKVRSSLLVAPCIRGMNGSSYRSKDSSSVRTLYLPGPPTSPLHQAAL